MDVFINKNADIRSAQYIVSKLNKIAGLRKKNIFKVVTTTAIQTNAQTFTFCFVHEVKNESIDKTYEKSRLVIQVYNDQEKDLILTKLPTIQHVN